jgi:hypothetical protein
LVLIAFAASLLFIMFERHRTSSVSGTRTVFDVCLALLLCYVIGWCIREPFVYTGVQYNRHWCGVASNADGRCNVY